MAALEGSSSPSGAAKGTQKSSTRGMAKESRQIPMRMQCLLWGRAAGRCEFRGCNRPLWKSGITQEEVNIAQKAHIVPFSELGPRGSAKSGGPAHSLDNLMLVCHECHTKIDTEKSGGRYSVEFLREAKREHEQRIELVTDIDADRKSSILLYGANVGQHSSPLVFGEAASALFPGRYPSAGVAISLGMINSSFSDDEIDFWAIEEKNLRRKFKAGVSDRLSVGEIAHLSVFAIAPQPLLILLGHLLGDILPIDVYQRHREPAPPTWVWPKAACTEPFEVRVPATTSGAPALVLALSGTVATDRIASVLGKEASIWTVTVQNPHNDLVKSTVQLSEFRSLIRRLLNEIKAAYGQATLLHVFPVAPVSVAIEFGRVRMPKADMPWKIYDQVNSRGGFIPALFIPMENKDAN
jgi:hypothetical protein